METFFFNPLLLDISFPATCNKDTFDNKYRYDATKDWTKVSCSQADFRAFKQI